MHRFIVITTPTCRKCKDLENQDKELGLGMKFVNFRDPEVASLVAELGVAQAGTIIDTENRTIVSIEDVIQNK